MESSALPYLYGLFLFGLTLLCSEKKCVALCRDCWSTFAIMPKTDDCGIL